MDNLRKNIKRREEVKRKVRLPYSIHVTVAQRTIPQLAEGLQVIFVPNQVLNEVILIS